MLLQIFSAVMAFVALAGAGGTVAAAMMRLANRLALLEERVVGLQSDMRAEQARNEQQNLLMGELGVRLARIEEKLDLVLGERRFPLKTEKP